MAKKNTKKSDAAVANARISRDIFDVSFFGTKVRMSLIIYIVAAISLLSFFLPYTNNTIQERNLNSTDGHSYNSKVSDMKWNEASSSGFDIVIGKKVPYVKESKAEYKIRLPLTNEGFVAGSNARDTFLYLSYGSLVAILIPLVAVYVMILNACRSQWQKGGAFLINAFVTLISAGIHVYLVYDLASGYLDSKVGGKTLDNRITDVISNLGIGFYISFLTIVALFVFSVYSFVALKAKKGYPVASARSLLEANEVAEAAEVAEEATEEAVEEVVVEETVAE